MLVLKIIMIILLSLLFLFAVFLTVAVSAIFIMSGRASQAEERFEREWLRNHSDTTAHTSKDYNND